VLDDRDHRLPRHVTTADQDVGVVELRRVDELPPADFGSAQIGGVKDSHSFLLQNLPNGVLEARDVLAHDGFRPGGVARNDRVEELAMFLDRLLEANAAVEAEEPDAKTQVETLFQHRL